MIGRTVKVQLVIFSLLTITALLLIFFRYSHLPAALGINQIHVSAELPETGGLYPNANVTYRGYPIGKVEQISQTPGGVKIDMAIDRRLAPPQNSHVEVHSVSAIGEQFLDFVPDAAPSTPMHDGTLVPRGQAGPERRVRRRMAALRRGGGEGPVRGDGRGGQLEQRAAAAAVEHVHVREVHQHRRPPPRAKIARRQLWHANGPRSPRPLVTLPTLPRALSTRQN